jgi:hypothetical protein
MDESTITESEENNGGIREQRRDEVKKKAERRSLMFDAKNASRLIFTQNAPPVPQLPQFIGQKPLGSKSSQERLQGGPAPTKKILQQSYRTSVLVSDDSDDEPPRYNKPLNNAQKNLNVSIEDIASPKNWPGLDDDQSDNEDQVKPMPTERKVSNNSREQQQPPQPLPVPLKKGRDENSQLLPGQAPQQGRSPPAANTVGGMGSSRLVNNGMTYQGGPRGASLNNPARDGQSTSQPMRGAAGPSPLRNDSNNNAINPLRSASQPSQQAQSSGPGGVRDSGASDIVKRMIAQQEAKAQVMKSRLSEIARRDSLRSQSVNGAPGNDLKNITMEPWSQFESAEHIRWGSLEKSMEETAAEQEQQYKANSPQLQSPPAGKRSPKTASGTASPRMGPNSGGPNSPLAQRTPSNNPSQSSFSSSSQFQPVSPKGTKFNMGGAPRAPGQLPASSSSRTPTSPRFNVQQQLPNGGGSQQSSFSPSYNQQQQPSLYQQNYQNQQGQQQQRMGAGQYNQQPSEMDDFMDIYQQGGDDDLR